MTRTPDIEDLLGGRLLAWIGGLAVLVGVALLLALAITSGWLGEAERTLLAATGSLALLGTGVLLHERGGRTEAARAATGTGLAGLFLTLTVAVRAYDLLPVALGLPLALGAGAVAVALAVRWHARAIAGLGIVGATLSPALTDAPVDGAAMAFLLVAVACATAVVLWRRWDWLALAAFAAATPQWLAYLADGPGVAGAIVVLGLFGGLNALAALGYEVRVPARRVRGSSAFLVVLNAVVLTVAGYLCLRTIDGETLAVGWLVALAGVHAAAAAVLARREPEARDVQRLCLVLAALIADAAFALAFDGPARAIGWAAASVAFAALGRRAAGGRDRRLAELGLGGHVGLALVQAMAQVDVGHVAAPGASGGATAALAALAAACLTSGRLAPAGDRRLRIALDAVGLGAAAMIAALSLDGAALTTAWALEAAALAGLARRTGDDVAHGAALAHLGAAAAWALADQAQPGHLLDGAAELGQAALGLGSVAAAALWAMRNTPDPRRRGALAATAGVTLLYLGSLAAVALSPEASSEEMVTLGIAREQGQLQLSALWAVTGVVGLLAGLRRDIRELRLGALALLGLTTGKVFLFDLAALTAGYRVGSFIALGVLLLAGSFAYARLRPAPLPDLREVPDVLR